MKVLVHSWANVSYLPFRKKEKNEEIENRRGEKSSAMIGHRSATRNCVCLSVWSCYQHMHIHFKSHLLYIKSFKENVLILVLKRGGKHSKYFKIGRKADTWAMKCRRLLKESYQSDFAYFRKVCLDRSWCVWGSAEMPCALRVLGPIS